MTSEWRTAGAGARVPGARGGGTRTARCMSAARAFSAAHAAAACGCSAAHTPQLKPPLRTHPNARPRACSTWFMRMKTAALWTLGMAVVLGLSIGVAYGERAAQLLSC